MLFNKPVSAQKLRTKFDQNPLVFSKMTDISRSADRQTITSKRAFIELTSSYQGLERIFLSKILNFAKQKKIHLPSLIELRRFGSKNEHSKHMNNVNIRFPIIRIDSSLQVFEALNCTRTKVCVSEKYQEHEIP
jgi:hypothetical protein